MIFFFSGGLDSTTVAFDALSCPARYGISLEGRPTATLLTVAFDREDRLQKRLNLRKLVEAIRKVNSRVEVVHRVVTLPRYMESYTRRLGVVEGSFEPHTAAKPSGSTISQVRQSMASPYTPGLHTFMASVAINLSHRDENPIPHHNDPQAFWGFKFEGPVLEAMDRGEGAKSDTTAEFVDSMNVMSCSLGHPTTLYFRAPFLENRMDRYQIVTLARHLGVPVSDTSSCINGWMVKCGHCRQCVVRNQAIAAYGVLH